MQVTVQKLNFYLFIIIDVSLFIWTLHTSTIVDDVAIRSNDKHCNIININMRQNTNTRVIQKNKNKAILAFKIVTDISY